MALGLAAPAAAQQRDGVPSRFDLVRTASLADFLDAGWQPIDVVNTLQGVLLERGGVYVYCILSTEFRSSRAQPTLVSTCYQLNGDAPVQP